MLTTHVLTIAALLLTAPPAAAADVPVALDRAEKLLAVAEDGLLTDELTAEAAQLLTNDDPFVRAVADLPMSPGCCPCSADRRE